MTVQNAALRVIKNTAALLASKAFAMVFSFIFIIYAARLLGVDGFGKYALVRGYFELFLSLSATGLSIVITREMAKRPSWADRYLNTSVVLVSILTVVASGILVTIVHVLAYASDTRAATYLACLALMPATINLVLESAFVAFEKAEYVTYGTLIENILRTVLGLIVLFLGYGLLALFVVLIIARICMLLFYLVFLSRQIAKLHWHFDWSFLKRLVRDWRVFALENWLSSLFWTLDVILLSMFHGERAVGFYAAAYRTLSLATVVAGSYTTAIFPYISRLFKESEEAFRQVSENSLKYMVAFVLPVAVIISVLADRIVILLYTVEYADSIPILGVLIWVMVLKFLNPFLSHILFARGEQRKSLQVAAISLAFYMVVCFWLTPRWGGIGAAWALLLAVGLAFCLYLDFIWRREGVSRVLLTLGRTILAATSFAVFVLLIMNIPLMLLLILAGLIYFLLLFIFRVFSSREIHLFRKMVLRGLHEASKTMQRT
ncbi:MAG: flippase [Candidatus Hodarchaeota archaeon]